MRAGIITFEPWAVDIDGISVSATVGANAFMVLGGAVGTTLPTEMSVDIESGADASGSIWVVKGTRKGGATVVEAVVGGAAGITVSTRNAFKTVTSIQNVGASLATCFAGIGKNADTLASTISRWYPLNHYSGDATTSLQLEFIGTGTITIQGTLINVMNRTGEDNQGKHVIHAASEADMIYADPHPIDLNVAIGTGDAVTGIGGFLAAGATADSNGALDFPVAAVRMLATAAVVTDDIKLIIRQAGRTW